MNPTKRLQKSPTVCSPTKRLHQDLILRTVHKRRVANPQKSNNTPEKKCMVVRRYNTLIKAKKRLEYSRTKMIEEIRLYEEKVKQLTDQTIEDYIDRYKIGPAQSMVLREIIQIAKCSSKHVRRYSADWLLMCLLISIRSPRPMYNCILANEILPLPCPKTIRRRLSSINVGCGFDASFFEALKKKLATKTEQQKQFVLIFDEMSARKCLKTDVKSMKYQGVVDFGEDEVQSTKKDDLADHALVFAISSLHEDHFQPVGCFAAKGSTKGVTLAKLVLQAIFLLEKAGAKVVSLICDGAKPNRNMWSQFGVSGKIGATKHFFENPYDDERKIFFLSDMPHLFKCLQNRLLKHELMVCGFSQ